MQNFAIAGKAKKVLRLIDYKAKKEAEDKARRDFCRKRLGY